MKHPGFEQLSLCLDEALTGAERLILERHLESCPECRADYLALAAQEEGLARALAPEPSAEWLDALERRVLERVAAEDSGRSLARRRVPVPPGSGPERRAPSAGPEAAVVPPRPGAPAARAPVRERLVPVARRRRPPRAVIAVTAGSAFALLAFVGIVRMGRDLPGHGRVGAGVLVAAGGSRVEERAAESRTEPAPSSGTSAAQAPTARGGPFSSLPANVLQAARRALEASRAAAAAGTPAGYDAAAAEWERVLTLVREGAPWREALFDLAEARAHAWDLGPSPIRTKAARTALDAALAEHPTGDRGARFVAWRARLGR